MASFNSRLRQPLEFAHGTPEQRARYRKYLRHNRAKKPVAKKAPPHKKIYGATMYDVYGVGNEAVCVFAKSKTKAKGTAKRRAGIRGRLPENPRAVRSVWRG